MILPLPNKTDLFCSGYLPFCVVHRRLCAYCYNSSMFQEGIRRHPRSTALVAGAGVILLLCLIWWNFVLQNPTRVWHDMLRNNLTTSSVTKHITGKSGYQSIDQYIRFQLGSTNASDWLVIAKQAQNSNVTTESIGTPNAGYVRYVEINSPRVSNQGKPYDFSSVTNIWGKSTDSTSTLGQLYSQSLLNLNTAPMPPVGNLPYDKRQVILRYIEKQQVLVPNYTTMKRATLNGHRVYVYDVSVKLAPYLLVMQAFAKDLGLHDLDNIDATQYLNAKPVTLQFSVDSKTHLLLKVAYPSAKYSETYENYGLLTPISIPARTIPVEKLQSNLQKLE